MPVDAAGRLRIKVPAALVERYGTHLDVGAPVAFGYRGTEWGVRVAGRKAVRYDVSYDSCRGRWYLDASWKHPPPAANTVRAATEQNSLLLTHEERLA